MRCVWCRLAVQAIAASGSTPAGDVTAALQEARAEWTTLEMSRISCWQRLSGSDTAAGTGGVDAAGVGGDVPGSGTAQGSGTAREPSAGPEGQPLRGLLKRSPLPSVCPAAPPTAPLLEAGGAFAVSTPPGSFDGDAPLPASGGHSLLEPPALPLFQQSAPVEEVRGTAGEGEMPRQRSVRFSDQAAVKRYENSEEPIRVAGEPEGMESVATRSPQKRVGGVRRKRRRMGSGGAAEAVEVSGDIDEVEEGEVADGPVRALSMLDEPAAGSSMYAL